MTWHIGQLKPKTALLVFGVTSATCTCTHKRSLLSLSANQNPSWLLQGVGLECMSVSLAQWGENNKQWECRWVLLLLCAKAGRKKSSFTFDDVWRIKQVHPLQNRDETGTEKPISRWIRKHTEGCRVRTRWFLVCVYKEYFSGIQ